MCRPPVAAEAGAAAAAIKRRAAKGYVCECVCVCLSFAYVCAARETLNDMPKLMHCNICMYVCRRFSYQEKRNGATFLLLLLWHT